MSRRVTRSILREEDVKSELTAVLRQQSSSLSVKQHSKLKKRNLYSDSEEEDEDEQQQKQIKNLEEDRKKQESTLSLTNTKTNTKLNGNNIKTTKESPQKKGNERNYKKCNKEESEVEESDEEEEDEQENDEKNADNQEEENGEENNNDKEQEEEEEAESDEENDDDVEENDDDNKEEEGEEEEEDKSKDRKNYNASKLKRHPSKNIKEESKGSSDESGSEEDSNEEQENSNEEEENSNEEDSNEEQEENSDEEQEEEERGENDESVTGDPEDEEKNSNTIIEERKTISKRRIEELKKPLTLQTSHVATPFGALNYLTEVLKLQLEPGMRNPSVSEFEMRFGSWKASSTSGSKHHQWVSTVQKAQAEEWVTQWRQCWDIKYLFELQLFLSETNERVTIPFYSSERVAQEYVCSMSEIRTISKTAVTDRDWIVAIGPTLTQLGLRSSLRMETPIESTNTSIVDILKSKLPQTSAPSHSKNKKGWHSFTLKGLSKLFSPKQEQFVSCSFFRVKTIREFHPLPYIQIHVSNVTSGTQYLQTLDAPQTFEVEIEVLFQHPKCPKNVDSIVSELYNMLNLFFRDPSISNIGLWPHPFLSR